MAKVKEVLHWRGNSIPGVERRRLKRGEFKIELDVDGKKYWLASTADGQPRDRLPVEDSVAPYMEVTDAATGETIFDSRQKSKSLKEPLSS